MQSNHSARSTPPAINFEHKLGLIADHWQPRVIAEMNDYQFKLVKILGDFIMHSHAGTDEAFIVLKGRLRIDFADRHVCVDAGEMVVVPKGIEHKTSALEEVQMLLIEPRGVPNTGDQGGSRTAPNDAWI